MKIYYLHLTQDDFTQDGNVWTSDVIDLYNNDQYKNYSATKSDYGLNLLGDNTWTGMELISPGITDSGIIDSGKFIDYSGRIDIMMQSLELSDLPGDGDVTTKVNIYTIDDSAESFPDNWAQKNEISSYRPILWINAYRYAVFQITFTSEQDISSATLDYNVRVEIDKPVMAPMYRRTRSLLDKFPEWMKIRDDIPESATPALDKPETLGGQLLNAVAGEWLTELDAKLEQIRMQRYIKTADLDQVAWVYYVPDVPDNLLELLGDGNVLVNTSDLIEFYEADEDDDVYYWDEFKKTIYVRVQYDTITINGVDRELELQQIWNWFDEHGAIVDLMRHHGEDNLTFRSRILDVYINQPGTSLNAFKLALRRELNLWKSFDSNATPDSFALGATPVVLEIEDIEEADDFINPDWTSKDKFIKLVEYLAEAYPVTWGYFRWDKSLWDVAGKDNEGFAILPYRYDATPVSEEETQSGVGDGADLFVYRPDDITGPREFNYRMKVRGRQRATRDEYPEITISVDIYGQADKEIFDNPVLEPWFSIIYSDGTTTYYTSVQASVQSDVDNETPLPTSDSYYIFQVVGPDGFTDTDLVWYDQDGNTYANDDATPFYLDPNAMTSMSVQWGRYDPNTETFTDYPADNSATLWFAEDSATPNELPANDDDTTISPVTPVDATAIIIESNTTSSSVATWESEHQPHIIKINGALPDNDEQPTTIPVPFILWDPYLESPPNKEIIVEMTLLDSDGNLVVSTTDANNNSFELDHTVISVNGDNSWSSGMLNFDADTTTELEFSSGTSVDPPYPIETSVWSLFEAVETSLRYGVVDENGPWRQGKPQEPGAFNFLLDQIDIGRDEFGLSSSDDYVITWIGVDVIGTNRVLAWLDSNVVNPATDDDNEVSYPANAVDEEWSATVGNYVFEPFFVRARMRPDIDPQWNPQVHSGWFYERQREWYLYANAITETATATNWTLADVARQGAPIILKTDEATPVEYREVTFFDEATPVLTLMNKETVRGTDTPDLYVAYEDVFDIQVIDLATGEDITAGTYTEDNVVTTSVTTSRDKYYEVDYKVNRSFIADNEYVVGGKNKTNIEIVERVPFGGDYTIAYEGSDYDPATPVDLALNTFYTTQDEGFIFLSHNEYDLHYVEAKLSPTKFLADGEDYIMLSLKSYDQYFNPKGNQTFTLTASFGTFEETNTDTVTVTTDIDGFATAILLSEVSTASLTGYVEVDGPGLVDATVNYEIDPVKSRPYRLVALPSADAIQADAESQIIVYGKVEDSDYAPVPYAAVAWKKDRSMADVFLRAYDGQVIADENGVFSIGPLTSATPDEPGYWFLVAESWSQGASPSGDVDAPDYDSPPYDSPEFGPIGDVVFWNEYPDIKFGVNDANELPKQAVQMTVKANDQVYYSNQNAFPVTYDDATPLDAATPVTFDYDPPPWYAIDRYTQYQLGLLGTGFYSVDLGSLNDAPPDYKDL